MRGIDINSDMFPSPVISPCSSKKGNVRSKIQNNNLVQILTKSGDKEYHLQIDQEFCKESTYGFVYKAHGLILREDMQFEHTGEAFAVKVYRRKSVCAKVNDYSRENPLHEFSALQILGTSHPNILHQEFCGVDDAQWYSVMPFCDGSDVLERVMAKGKFTAAEAKDFIRQVAGGLHYIHQSALAHRDLSLENVLYCPVLNRYYIIDFGMSILLTRNESDGTFLPVRRLPKVGKEFYVSPEARACVEYVQPQQGDMWALGVMLFIVLMGRPPFRRADVSDGNYANVQRNQLHLLLTPEEEAPAADAWDLLQRLLVSNPADRYTIQQTLAHPFLS